MTLQPLIGFAVIITLGWLSSNARHQFPFKLVAISVLLQILLAVMLLKIALLQDFLLIINQFVLAIENATNAGTRLVFGYLGGGTPPFDVSQPANSFLLAFQALPIVIVFSALSAVLWYWRIIPWVISGFAWALQRSFGIGGAVGLGSASSIFVGMVESPLLIRPYIARMSESELFVVMSCGMATVAGTVMALYASILGQVMDNPLSHILIASVISAPAAIMMALIIRPNESDEKVNLSTEAEEPRYTSTMHAITTGAQDGLKLFLNIIAMLIVFVALVHLANQILSNITIAEKPLTLEYMLGMLLSPLMWCIGIPWQETQMAGQLMATKVILNELLAYLQLTALPTEQFSEKSRLIMTYALCGFANFGSLGIMIGGLTSMCPERKSTIVRLAPLSIWSGALATSLTGAVVALIV